MTLRLLALLIAPLILTGCGSGTTIGDCSAAVTWQGRPYDGAGNAKGWHRGKPLGSGEIPACGPTKPAGRTTVYHVRGVPDEIAVAIGADSHSIYLGRGWEPELATHPLHDAFFRDPDEPRARRCRGQWNVAGTVKNGWGLALATDHGELEVFLHARTRVRGATRFGTAYLPAGTRIRLRGRMCFEYDSGARQRFADVIVVTG